MADVLPDWLNPEPWLSDDSAVDGDSIRSAIYSSSPGPRELAVLLSKEAGGYIEEMAQRAQAITLRHFGRTISLYVPLYASNYCSGGCIYCGFASDREQVRMKLSDIELEAEVKELKKQGFNDVLLLTGERTEEAGFEYLKDCVKTAAKHIHNVSAEAFSMSTDEYKELHAAGCTAITLYQETYNPELYKELHRWGQKQDYAFRLDAPSRAMEAGMRSLGLGVLLGLDDPVREAICLFLHAQHLLKKHWRSGVMISFPRICAQMGEYKPAYPVDDEFFARMIFAFRICLPDVPLVLSTRESARLRDGFAGVGVNRMSVASKTTVGGYCSDDQESGEQFEVTDTRDVDTFCAMLRLKDLEPVFKNWDSVFNA
jgi:2-iminoacetate synthase